MTFEAIPGYTHSIETVKAIKPVRNARFVKNIEAVLIDSLRGVCTIDEVFQNVYIAAIVR